MKSLVLSKEDADLLRSGKLEMVYLPLVERRDDQGRTYREACEHYRKYGPSEEQKQIRELLMKSGERNTPIKTAVLAVQYTSPYELGEDLLPYCEDSEGPVGRPLRVVDRIVNKDENRLEIVLKTI